MFHEQDPGQTGIGRTYVVKGFYFLSSFVRIKNYGKAGSSKEFVRIWLLFIGKPAAVCVFVCVHVCK